MISRKILRIAVIGAGLTAASLSGWTYAADDSTPPAKPAAPATTQAQRRGGGSPAEILKNYRDQFEGLNLTDDQMKKIDGFMETAEAEVKKSTGDDRDSRRAAFQAIRKLGEDVQSILTDTQKAALTAKRQSMMFDRITKTYTNPELKLTDDQTKQITGIIADTKKTISGLSFQNEDDRPKFRAAFEDMNTKLKAVLTPDQQKLIPQRGPRGNRGGGANPPA